MNVNVNRRNAMSTSMAVGMTEMAFRVACAFLEAESDVSAKATPKYSPDDIKVKFKGLPNIKPPRRRRKTENKTNRADSPKKYMEKYRDDGHDYQKKPDNKKEFDRKHRKLLQSL